MAVLISNGPTNLSAANGFLKAELYNLGLFGNVSGALSTPATISATFPTGSRNNAGIILAVMPTLGYANIDRSVKASLQQIMGTCTATASNDRITFVAHAFSANQPVMFSNSGGSLPGGLSGNTIYYVKTVVDADNFTLSTTAGGATLDITSNGTGTQTLYAERGASTLTAQQLLDYNGIIVSTSYNSNYHQAIVAFTWTGYAIDTTAGKWRFYVIQTGGTMGNHSLQTSDNTNPFFAEISSIAATATSNQDQIICASNSPVTIDRSFTFLGITAALPKLLKLPQEMGTLY